MLFWHYCSPKVCDGLNSNKSEFPTFIFTLYFIRHENYSVVRLFPELAAWSLPNWHLSAFKNPANRGIRTTKNFCD